MSHKSNLSLPERRKLAREKLLAAGLCGRCGKRRRIKAKSLCRKCTKDSKAYYDLNKAAIIVQVVDQQKKNRIATRIYLREYARKARLRAITKLGGKCVRCGFSDHRALQFDHINGDGYADKTKDGRRLSGIALLKKILADKAGKYQLLCANCNWIKRWENEEHGGLDGIRAKAEAGNGRKGAGTAHGGHRGGAYLDPYSICASRKNQGEARRRGLRTDPRRGL